MYGTCSHNHTAMRTCAGAIHTPGTPQFYKVSQLEWCVYKRLQSSISQNCRRCNNCSRTCGYLHDGMHATCRHGLWQEHPKQTLAHSCSGNCTRRMQSALMMPALPARLVTTNHMLQGYDSYLMTWFNDREIDNRLMLLNAMLTAAQACTRQEVMPLSRYLTLGPLGT